MNAERDTGQKISTQHRLIQSLLKGLRSNVANGDEPRAKRSLASLQRALEAHFSLEEQHYFPRARQARPEMEPSLRAFTLEHGDMLSAAERISRGLQDGDGATQALDALESTFFRHEKAERELFEA